MDCGEKLAVYFKNGKAQEVFATSSFLHNNKPVYSYLVVLSEGKREEIIIDGKLGFLFKINNEDKLVKFLHESKCAYEVCNEPPVNAINKRAVETLSRHLKELKLKLDNHVISSPRDITVMSHNERKRRVDKLLDELNQTILVERREIIKRQLRELRS